MTTDGSAVPEATLGTRAVKGFTWAAAALVGNRLAVFVGTLVLARLLTPADFGIVANALFLLQLFQIALDLGVGAAIVHDQETGVTPRVRAAFGLNLVVAVVLTAVGVACGPALATFFRAPQDALLFSVLPVYLLLRGAGQISNAVLQRDMAFRARTAVDVIRAIVRLAVSIPLALAGGGAWAIVIGMLAAEAVGSVVLLVLRPIRPTLRARRDDLRALLGYGSAVLGLRVSDEVWRNSDYVVVGRVLGPSATGQYRIGFQLPELVIDQLLWTFASVAFPAFAQARDVGAETLRATMLRALRLVALFGATTGVGLALVAADAVPLLYGDEWLPAVPVTVAVSLAMGLSAVGYASGPVFNATGRPGLLLRFNAPLAALMVGAFILTAPFGITAVAVCHLVMSVSYGVFRLGVANRLLSVGWATTVRALRPAMAAVAGILAAAGPARIAMAPGALRLVVVVAAGVAGAATGARLGDPTIAREARTLAVRALRRT